MKLDYTIVYAQSPNMNGTFNELREMVGEMMQDGYTLQGGVSITVTKSGMFCAVQTMIREREEND